MTIFLSRLVEACRAMSLGDPLDPGTDIGPVIDAKAAAKTIREYIEIGKKEGKLALACEVPAGLEERTGRDLRRAAHLLRHPAASSPGQRGGLRPGLGGHARRRFRPRPWTSPIPPPTS